MFLEEEGTRRGRVRVGRRRERSERAVVDGGDNLKREIERGNEVGN